MRRSAGVDFEAAKRDRARVVDRDGAYVGDCEVVYYDEETAEPSWLGVRTGFMPSRRVLVPVAGATADRDGTVRVDVAKDAVDASPAIDDEEIDPDTERRLAEHYGIDVAAPEPEAEAEPEALDEPSLVRHEEELHVQKTLEEAGSVRVRKHVETEEVEQEVPREVEYAGLERVPVDGEDSGLVETLPDGSVSIPVFAEEIVVTKRTIVRERVIVRKQKTTEPQTVSAELRRERVEIVADPGIQLDGDL